MWRFDFEEIPGGRRCRVRCGGSPATFAMILAAWESDAAFRSYFNRELADAPYSAFRWETPPVTSSTLESEWDFVLLDSPGLARTPDRNAFAEHFDPEAGVVSFANLGGDAVLVVPCPRGPDSAYGHLAAFVRNAPEAQREEMWRNVAAAMRTRIGKRPIWLSTAGAGVSWLHVRLDDRPKYYGWSEYRKSPQ